MAWRREVRTARGTDREPEVRAGVQAAKEALGERGTPWWEQSAAGAPSTMGARGPMRRYRDPVNRPAPPDCGTL